MSLTAFVLRHLAFEDLGTWEPVLRARGFSVSYCDMGVASPPAAATDAALLVVLGGPIGVGDKDDFPWLRDEIELIRTRLLAGRPTLGICLGAQLIAAALGSRVYPGPAKEIGWAPLSLTDEGRSSVVRHLDGALTSMLHWHGDTFDLPEGARLLASTDVCRNQIFSWRKHALAFQCHPEIDPAGIERWLIGHIGELRTVGASLPHLRDATEQFGPSLVQRSAVCLGEWLDTAEFGF